MIRYALVCEHGHEFEGWFASSVAYDDQLAAGLLACPVCETASVRKQIMAPAVATRSRGEVEVMRPEGRAALRQMFEEVRRRVESDFDYVGDAFAREARDIHEGRAEERGIYGEASPKEVRSLLEDGVKVAPLPPKLPDPDRLN